jgi:predicted RNA binding protein YcfA (HicA-like mRNA interferase family)
MPRLKTLSGPDVVGIFSEFEFVIASQRGSHVKLRRVLLDGTPQTLTIPNHRELDTGTLKAIYRQALRYIADEDLRSHFYSD